MIPCYRNLALLRFGLLVLVRLIVAGLLVSALLRASSSVQALLWFTFNWGATPRLVDRVTNSDVLAVAGAILSRVILAVVLIVYDRRLVAWFVPASGLSCPGCGYPLSAGPHTTCPECGLRLHSGSQGMVAPTTAPDEPAMSVPRETGHRQF